MNQTQDVAPIYSQLASDPDLGELVDLFVSEIPDRVSALRTALLDHDGERLGRLAHQLKGAAGSYGFPQLTSPLKSLELVAREPRPVFEIVAALEAVERLTRRVRAGVPE